MHRNNQTNSITNMAQITEIKVVLQEKTIFSKEDDSLEVIVHLDADYPYLSIKTERWVPQNIDEIADEVMDRIMPSYFALEKFLMSKQ